MIQICNLLGSVSYMVRNIYYGLCKYILRLSEKDYRSAVLSKFKFAIIWPVIDCRIEFSLIASMGTV